MRITVSERMMDAAKRVQRAKLAMAKSDISSFTETMREWADSHAMLGELVLEAIDAEFPTPAQTELERSE